MMLTPSRRDLWTVLIIFCCGMALGLAVNAFSPKGFDFRMAAGLKQAWQPAADWEDSPSATAEPGNTPTPSAARSTAAATPAVKP